MKKIVLISVAALLCAFVFMGCAPVASPLAGALYTNVDWPQGVTSNVGTSKHGESSCTSILSLIAMGDCSIQTTAKNAGITKIHHVDYNSTSILGLFGKLTVTVYGE